jgi:hypothetical protein
LAKNNLPKTPAAFDAWLGNFHKAFAANAKAWGFTSSDVKAWNAWYKNWQKSFAAWSEFNQYAKAFNQFQNQQFSAFQAFAQGFWSQSQKSQSSSNVSSNAKKAPARSKKTARPSTAKKATTAKVSATKTSATKTSATKTTKPAAKKTTVTTSTAKKSTAKRPTAKKPVPKKATATTKKVATAKANAPFVWFTSAKKGVNVYVGASRNGGFSLPAGAKSAWVETRTQGGRWTKLTNGSNFPFFHNVNGTKQVFYRACWVGNNNKKGPWSTTVSYGFGNKAAA